MTVLDPSSPLGAAKLGSSRAAAAARTPCGRRLDLVLYVGAPCRRGPVGGGVPSATEVRPPQSGVPRFCHRVGDLRGSR